MTIMTYHEITKTAMGSIKKKKKKSNKKEQ